MVEYQAHQCYQPLSHTVINGGCELVRYHHHFIYCLVPCPVLVMEF